MLEGIRTDEAFHLLWQNILKLQKHHGVHEPELPRKRKVPARYEIGTGEGQHSDTVEDVYRPVYFECLDFVVTYIRDRFNQPGYAVLKQLEDTLLKAVKGENYREQLESVLEFYKDEFIPSSLTTQRELLPEALKSHCNS